MQFIHNKMDRVSLYDNISVRPVSIENGRNKKKTQQKYHLKKKLMRYVGHKRCKSATETTGNTAPVNGPCGAVLTFHAWFLALLWEEGKEHHPAKCRARLRVVRG